MKKVKYHNEATFQEEEIEFPDEMVNFVLVMSESLGEIKLDDIDWKSYPKLYGPVMVDKDKKSLRFIVNLAKNRVDREIGKNLYIVKITKFE
jgi:hypothetical protein